MGSDYIKMDLVKVIDPDNVYNQGEVTYWAVDEDTFDNMIGVDYSRMNDKSLSKIRTEYLGEVNVQRQEN